MNKKYNGLNIKSMEKKYPEDYKKIILFLSESNIYFENMKIGEMMYLFDNELLTVPICKCGEKVKFRKYYTGYNTYCSKSCSAFFTHKNKKIKEKRISKLIECNNNPDIKSYMIEKSKETVKNFSVSKKEEINNKRKKTVMKKYGVNNIAELKKLPYTEKINKRFKNLKENVNKTGEYNFLKFDKKSNIIEISCINCKCDKKSFEIDRGLFFRRRLKGVKECINLNPKNGGSSKYEFEIMDILDNYDIKYIHRYKFNNNEIDIYLPFYKIGIEFNGNYWHSDLHKEDNYHLKKTITFRNEGIRIIHIWEDEWINDNNKIIDFLFAQLGINLINIYGRKCLVKNIGKKVTKEFLMENHLQKNLNVYTHSIGLYHENDLVSLLLMGTYRKNMGRDREKFKYEILRFCNKRKYNVYGSFSKLFKHFLKNNKVTSVLTYSDASKYVGNVYTKCGFVSKKITKPNYYYLDPKNSLKKYNRWNYRKDRLVSEGYDANKTEREIMFNRKYYRLYDVGNYSFEYIV